MFETPFGVILREARQLAGLSGLELAHLAGADKRRVSELERGKRFPSPREVEFFLNALPLDGARVHYSLKRHPESVQPLLGNARRLLGGRPYFPPAPEPAFRKFLSAYAAFPALVRPITGRLRSRRDFPQIFRLTRNMRFDSADEVLSVLHIFDIGATPALHPPNNCAAPPARIVDRAGKHGVGHRPHACLIFQNLVIFHQVTFATTPRQTVDLLVWDGSQWRVWEVDGAAHDSRNDDQRRDTLGIPVHRYTTATLEQAAYRREPYFAECLRISKAA